MPAKIVGLFFYNFCSKVNSISRLGETVSRESHKLQFSVQLGEAQQV